jgi:hypothetical protein
MPRSRPAVRLTAEGAYCHRRVCLNVGCGRLSEARCEGDPRTKQSVCGSSSAALSERTEGGRFELPDPCGSPIFKCVAGRTAPSLRVPRCLTPQGVPGIVVSLRIVLCLVVPLRILTITFTTSETRTSTLWISTSAARCSKCTSFCDAAGNTPNPWLCSRGDL